MACAIRKIVSESWEIALQCGYFTCAIAENLQTISTSASSNPVKIPITLIWAKYIAHVLIDEHAYICLLDIGLQVSTVSQSFYESNSSHLKICPLIELFEVKAANGQNVLRIHRNLTFLKDCFGSEVQVSILAPAVPGIHGNAQSTLLIGTNTFNCLYKNLSLTSKHKHKIPSTTLWLCGCSQSYAAETQAQREQQLRAGETGPEVVPAG